MILLIDTTTNPTAIGLYDYKDLKVKIIESNPENNRKLVAIIQKFLKLTTYQASPDHAQRDNLQLITAIGVINGPGTFTGVRTGVTIANAISYALKIPIYSVNTLTAQIPHPKNPKHPKDLKNLNDVVSLLSASNSEVYFARFNKGKMIGKIELVDIMNLNNRLNKGDLIVGDLKCEHAQNILISQYLNISSSTRIKTLLDLILCKKIKPVKQVLPLYIKKPNITQKKKS